MTPIDTIAHADGTPSELCVDSVRAVAAAAARVLKLGRASATDWEEWARSHRTNAATSADDRERVRAELWAAVTRCVTELRDDHSLPPEQILSTLKTAVAREAMIAGLDVEDCQLLVGAVVRATIDAYFASEH